MYKFIFVVALVAAALVMRGNYYAVSQSAADIVSVTASRSASVEGGISGKGSAFVQAPGAALAGGSELPSETGTLFTNLSDGTSSYVHTGSDPAPPLDYHEAMVADLESGEIMFGDHDATRWPLASLTKLMTSAVAVDVLDMNEKVTVTPEMFAVDPSDQTLKVGDRYTVADLMRIMLLQSSNVAAEAIAGGFGRDRFLAAMNARAAAFAMRNTYFSDAAGLSSANQSTADDLLLLAQKIYASYPQIFAITRQTAAIVTNLTTASKSVVKSINDFAGQKDFLGGKTGYTDVADGNLLSIFNFEKRPVLVVVMGTDEASRFANTTTLYGWFTKNYK
jgi:D-alanyl-D-alanine carboxypeptidase